jgi:hypothetical protein
MPALSRASKNARRSKRVGVCDVAANQAASKASERTTSGQVEIRDRSREPLKDASASSRSIKERPHPDMTSFKNDERDSERDIADEITPILNDDMGLMPYVEEPRS